MMIPKIIHQTWKSATLPPAFKKFMNTWKHHHPGWEHILWTDEMNREFIKKKFPWFLERFDSYGANIQRVDAARYFILFYYGGVYVDLDFLCLENIEPLLENKTCVFGREPDEHCQLHNKDIIVSNAFIACMPNHFFLKVLCDELNYNIQNNDHRNDNILESTGPFMLTDVLKRYSGENSVSVLDFDVMYPLTKEELLAIGIKKNLSKKDHIKLKNAYAVHYYWGTWWKRRYKNRIFHNIRDSITRLFS